MKKRFLAVVLTCIMSIGASPMALAATENISATEEQQEYEDLSEESVETVNEEEAEVTDKADLADSDSSFYEEQKTTKINGERFYESDMSAEITEDTDLQILYSGEALAEEAEADVNHAPIAGLQTLILNPETTIDGYCTKDTMIGLMWKWNGTEYSYDIDDNDSIEYYLEGVTEDNYSYLADPEGTYEGVVLYGLEPGEYNLIFYVMDTHSAKSNEIKIELTIVENKTDEGENLVELPNEGDSKSFDITIDHANEPKKILIAYPANGKKGNVNIDVLKNGEEKVASTGLALTLGADDGSVYAVRNWCAIESADAETANYTIVAKTKTGDAACIIKLISEAEFVENFSGMGNAVTIPDNTPIKGASCARIIKGRYKLINGSDNNSGEWFRYTADKDYTYFTTDSTKYDSLVIDIVDPETDEHLMTSTANDRKKATVTSTMFIYYTQIAMNTTPGKEYLIHIYSDKTVSANGFDDFYNLSVGVPYTGIARKNFTSDKGYSVPANKSTTFTIYVDGDESDRLKQGDLRFIPSNSTDRVKISSLRFKSPNGVIVYGQNGIYSHSSPINYENYLSSKDNIKIKGYWTVTATSSKALSDVRFQIIGTYDHIYGNYGN